MRYMSVAPLAAAAFAAIGASGGPAYADQNLRVTGPFAHENLAVYFVHGASAGGPVPLTLQEALAKGSVQVIETGRVNELQIENTGGEQVFVQAGDIVKGGKQDRVLTVSFLLPAEIRTHADRVVLRRAGALVGARQGGGGAILERARSDAVGIGAARHGGTSSLRRGSRRICRPLA